MIMISGLINLLLTVDSVTSLWSRGKSYNAYLRSRPRPPGVSKYVQISPAILEVIDIYLDQYVRRPIPHRRPFTSESLVLEVPSQHAVDHTTF